jgi:3-polyprenyl-4-hydroxybenzoate decarboxylase
VAINTYLLGSVNVGVKFKLKPTVLYAEKHSKTTVKTGVPSGSKINNAMIEIPITIKDMHKIANALDVDSLEIRLPNN